MLKIVQDTAETDECCVMMEHSTIEIASFELLSCHHHNHPEVVENRLIKFLLIATHFLIDIISSLFFFIGSLLLQQAQILFNVLTVILLVWIVSSDNTQ